jgi:hypothetical protein
LRAIAICLSIPYPCDRALWPRGVPIDRGSEMLFTIRLAFGLVRISTRWRNRSSAPALVNARIDPPHFCILCTCEESI